MKENKQYKLKVNPMIISQFSLYQRLNKLGSILNYVISLRNNFNSHSNEHQIKQTKF